MPREANWVIMRDSLAEFIAIFYEDDPPPGYEVNQYAWNGLRRVYCFHKDNNGHNAKTVGGFASEHATVAAAWKDYYQCFG